MDPTKSDHNKQLITLTMITLSSCNFCNLIKKSPSKFFTGCSTSTYLKSNGKLACGIYLDKKLSFTSAQKACKDLNAALPEIRSKLENKDVWERMVMFQRKRKENDRFVIFLLRGI
jgi:hypothetical protein